MKISPRIVSASRAALLPVGIGSLVALPLALVACGSPAGGSPATAGVPARGPATADSPASASSPACVPHSGFSLSLVSDRGGAPTPVGAAQSFGQHGGVPGIPLTGWDEIRRGAGFAVVASGSVTLHVIQGPDLTWQVDSGERRAGVN